MFLPDPENIGCGRKLGPEAIADIRSYLQSENVIFSSGDYSCLEVTQLVGASFLISSIDRTVRFTGDNLTYAQNAIAHCCNDIIAGGAKPRHMQASLGFTSQEIEQKEHISVSRIIHEEAANLGISMGKIHSYQDAVGSITLNVSGFSKQKPALTGYYGGIFLTKKLGFLKHSYLTQIGHRCQLSSDRGRQEPYMSAEFIELLSDRKYPGTDVSGFGLIYDLDELAKRYGVLGEVDIDKVMTYSSLVHTVDVSCLERTASYTPKELQVRSAGSVGSLSELNGPLALLVGEADAGNFAERALECGMPFAHRIGSWKTKNE